jgi:hypothetical protein
MNSNLIFYFNKHLNKSVFYEFETANADIFVAVWILLIIRSTEL